MSDTSKDINDIIDPNGNADNKVDLVEFCGVKAGMTRIFDTRGNHVPVTVIKLIPNRISQVKTKEKDGYEAYQVAYGEKRESLVSKPVKGHLKSAKIEQSLTRFFEVSTEVEASNLGKEVGFDAFAEESYVDVTGISKGKGCQGVIKRFHFAGGPASHGSHFHRRPGSIGQRATPARVYANKKLPGHMGAKTRTTQNLKVIAVNVEKGFMLIKGSVPGAKNSFVRIKKAIKKQNQQNAK